MIFRNDLLHAIEDRLQSHRFRDYCPNGLQVEARACIRRIVSGVTACQALLDAAVAADADAVVVHHGYFWKGEDARVTGLRKQRLQTLLAHDINLFAWHLPLDAHAELGNNARLGEVLGLQASGPMGRGEDALGLVGKLPTALPAAAFAALVGERLERMPMHIGQPDDMIHSIAWCTGAAQGFIDQAHASGVDAYLSGEISEQTVHFARETGIHYFAAGHHATERYGVQALGEWLAAEFGLDHQFIDIDNPV